MQGNIFFTTSDLGKEVDPPPIKVKNNIVWKNFLGIIQQLRHPFLRHFHFRLVGSAFL